MDKNPVLPDQLTIEVHLSTTILTSLDLYQIPVDCRLISIVAIFIGITRGEVDSTIDFLVKEDIIHGVHDAWIAS